MSRTRCSAPALLRRAGTTFVFATMDPGSAAHHAAKSGALHSIRGTQTKSYYGIIPEQPAGLNPESRDSGFALRAPWNDGDHAAAFLPSPNASASR